MNGLSLAVETPEPKRNRFEVLAYPTYYCIVLEYRSYVSYHTMTKTAGWNRDCHQNSTETVLIDHDDVKIHTTKK